LEDCEPAFEHHPPSAIPSLKIGDATIRVIVGEVYGRASPVTRYSPTLYLECQLPAGVDFTLPRVCPEVAVYMVSGSIQIDARCYVEGTMAVAAQGWPVRISANAASHLLVIGGESLGYRKVWWNFVSSSMDKIDAAQRAWRKQEYRTVSGESGFDPGPTYSGTGRDLS
jgi:redox-sensitive bicupin YhaK (pirin superfamily)